MSINLIMAEFGKDRQNAGDSNLSNFGRLDPTLSSMLKYFPDLKLTLYTDFDINLNGANVEIIKVPTFNSNNSRDPWRTTDYYKFFGMLSSESDIAIAMDSDMYVCSDKVKDICKITEKFGFCMPANPRYLNKVDYERGIDGGTLSADEKNLLYGFSCNVTPMSLYKKSINGRLFFERVCEIYKNNPSRANTVVVKAMWETGLYPYLLPFQWCVCGGFTGLGNELILHVGHKEVKDFYRV